MGFIKNYDSLDSTPQRKIVLDLIESALAAIQPSQVLAHHFSLANNHLKVKDEVFDLSQFDRVFVVGFGKGAAGIAQIVEKTLGDRLTDGYVIDTVAQKFEKIHFTLGTHPLPSQTNIDFTNRVLEKLTGLTEKDLVLVIICGGGSALFEAPVSLSVEKLIQVFHDMLNSGANIEEMNIVRKHLSKVKGGGLAYRLYPARICSLIFSDVPGNDLSTIASGPTVKDIHSIADTEAVVKKYHLGNDLSEKDFEVTPSEDKYFTAVSNIIMVSNMTALEAMEKKADELGLKVGVLSDRIQGDAKQLGKELIDQAQPGEILLAGGETTVHVLGKGIGGRNQTVVLAALPYVSDTVTIASVGTDGWDFTTFAGAIGDGKTVARARELSLLPEEFLRNDDSTEFFQKTGDGIDTGRLESNVSDIMIVLRT